jgi:hypothetical protein
VAVRPRFDPKRPLVAARDFTFMGTAYSPGDPFGPFEPGVVSDRLRARQYEARAVNFGEAAAPAEEADTSPVQMTESETKHTYLITAPWLDEPVRVRGVKNAEKRKAEIEAEGPPLGFIDGGSAVTVEGGDGGWYEISAPWLAEPEKVQGREAAETRQRELHDTGEPASYSGFTLTEGENGWYAITKDGVETDPPAELKVHGEEAARQAVAQLRAGEQPEGTALPEEWAAQPGNDTTDDDQPEDDENSDQAEGDEEPPADEGAETPPADGQTGEAKEDTMPKEGQPSVEGDAPNEPGTNQPNGAEVINDQKVAEGQTADDDGDGEDAEGGDGSTGPVGP